MLNDIVDVIQGASAFIIILLVLFQPSKGSDLGSMAGGSNASGNKTYIDPLTKITGVIMMVFILSSFLVTYLDNETQNSSVISSYVSEKVEGVDKNDK